MLGCASVIFLVASLTAVACGRSERGTAKSAGARLGALEWRLGGKTGTGPFGAEPHDGWFAGLIFDRTAPRYTVAVYVERHGPGGVVAAGIAAEITRLLAARP